MSIRLASDRVEHGGGCPHQLEPGPVPAAEPRVLQVVVGHEVGDEVVERHRPRHAGGAGGRREEPVVGHRHLHGGGEVEQTDRRPVDVVRPTELARLHETLGQADLRERQVGIDGVGRDRLRIDRLDGGRQVGDVAGNPPVPLVDALDGTEVDHDPTEGRLNVGQWLRCRPGACRWQSPPARRVPSTSAGG